MKKFFNIIMAAVICLTVAFGTTVAAQEEVVSLAPASSLPDVFIQDMDYFSAEQTGEHTGSAGNISRSNIWLNSDGTKRTIDDSWLDNLGNIYMHGGIIASGLQTILVNTRFRYSLHSLNYWLGGEYSRFTGTIAVRSASWRGRTQIIFYGDDEEIYTSDFIFNNTVPFEFDVDVEAVSQLRIVFSITLASYHGEWGDNSMNFNVAIAHAGFHRSAEPQPSWFPSDFPAPATNLASLVPIRHSGSGWVDSAGDVWQTPAGWRDNIGSTYANGGIWSGNDNTGGSCVTYSLGGRYTRFTGTLALCFRDRNAQQYYRFRVFGDGVAIYTSPIISRDIPPQHFDIDVRGIDELRLQRVATGTAGFGVVNAGFHTGSTAAARPLAISLTEMEWLSLTPRIANNGWTHADGRVRVGYHNHPVWPVFWHDNFGRRYEGDAVVSLAGGTITYLLNREFSNFTGTIGFVGPSQVHGTHRVSIYGDDILLFETPAFLYGTAPVRFDVDVRDVQRLHIVRRAANNRYIAIFQPILTRTRTPAAPRPIAPRHEPDTFLHLLSYNRLFPAAGNPGNGWTHANGDMRRIGADWRDNTGNAYVHGGIWTGNSAVPETDLSNTINRAHQHRVIYRLNRRYSRFTGTIALCFDSRDAHNEYVIRIWGDNPAVPIYTSPAISGGAMPINFDIDVTGVQELSIERVAGGNAAIGITNAGFHINQLPPEPIPGDIDLDTRLTIADAEILRRHLVGQSTIIYNNAQSAANADFNEDGTVDIIDLTALRLYMASK